MSELVRYGIYTLATISASISPNTGSTFGGIFVNEVVISGWTENSSCSFGNMSMITALQWIPRGAAASFPTKYDIDEDELARISASAKLQLEDAQEDLEIANNVGKAGNEMDDSDMDEEGGVATVHSKA